MHCKTALRRSWWVEQTWTGPFPEILDKNPQQNVGQSCSEFQEKCVPASVATPTRTPRLASRWIFVGAADELGNPRRPGSPASSSIICCWCWWVFLILCCNPCWLAFTLNSERRALTLGNVMSKMSLFVCPNQLETGCFKRCCKDLPWSLLVGTSGTARCFAGRCFDAHVWCTGLLFRHS